MKDLLRDPELVSEIASALRSAEARAESPSCRECENACRDGAVRAGAGCVREDAGASPAVALVSALKPYLNQRRREKADALTKALSAAELYRGLKSNRG